jgi:hypothetical protein
VTARQSHCAGKSLSRRHASGRGVLTTSPASCSGGSGWGSSLEAPLPPPPPNIIVMSKLLPFSCRPTGEWSQARRRARAACRACHPADVVPWRAKAQDRTTPRTCTATIVGCAFWRATLFPKGGCGLWLRPGCGPRGRRVGVGRVAAADVPAARSAPPRRSRRRSSRGAPSTSLRSTIVQGSTVPLLPPRAYNVYSCRRLLGEYSYGRTAVASTPRCSAVFFRPYTRCLPAVNSAPQLSQIKKLWDLLVDLSYC